MLKYKITIATAFIIGLFITNIAMAQITADINTAAIFMYEHIGDNSDPDKNISIEQFPAMPQQVSLRSAKSQ